MSRPIGSGLDERAFPLHIFGEEILPYLERDHARALVALLMYGTLTAAEEGRMTLDTAYRLVLNRPVFLYLRDWLKPRDRILEEVLSCSAQLVTLGDTARRQDIRRVCAKIKAKLMSPR